MEEKIKEIGYRDIFKQKEYMKAVLANGVNRFGDSIDCIAFIWLVNELTHSASWAAIVFAVNMLPGVVIQPFSGAVVEKMNKKKIMVITDCIRGIVVVSLAVILMTGHLTPYMLLGFTIVNSSVEAFRIPAGMAIVPQILDETMYSFGTGLYSSSGKVMELIGTGSAGIIIGFFGLKGAFLVDGVTFFASAFIVLSIYIEKEEKEKVNLDVSTYLQNLRDGFQYVLSMPAIRNITLLMVVANVIYVPFNSFQAPFVNDILRQGAGLLSALSVGLSIGIVMGSAAYPYIRKKLSGRSTVVLGGITIGCTYFIYFITSKLTENTIIIYASITLATFLMGIGASFLNTFTYVEIMEQTDKGYIARTSAILGAASMLSVPIVAFLCSVLVNIISIPTIFMTFGTVCIILFLYISVKKIKFERDQILQEESDMNENIKVMDEIDLQYEGYSLLTLIADDFSYEDLRKNVISRYKITGTRFYERMEEVARIYDEISKKLSADKERITYYFQNMEGCSDNLASFILLYDPMIYKDTIENVKERVSGMSETERIIEFSKRLDGFSKLEIDNEDSKDMTVLELLKKINSSDLDSESKLAIQGIFMDRELYLNEVADILDNAVNLIDDYKDEMKAFALEFYELWTELLKNEELYALMRENAHVSLEKNCKGVLLVPNIFYCCSANFCVGTNKVLEEERRPDVFRYGIEQIEWFTQPESELNLAYVNQILKLLSDKSKFEIMMQIKDKGVYGSELARRLNLSTPTISYHTQALLSAGLVEVKKENNRVYYSASKKKLGEFLNVMGQLLI